MLSVRAPVSGVVRAMADVPDPVFGGELVGPGLAVDPDGDGLVDVVAPVDGTLAKLHPHAFVVVTARGRAVLVHLGIDTVQLHGAGFAVVAAEGDIVTAGDVVVRWTPADVAAAGRSPVCPVVALDGTGAVDPVARVGARVQAGDALFAWT